MSSSSRPTPRAVPAGAGGGDGGSGRAPRDAIKALRELQRRREALICEIRRELLETPEHQTPTE